MRYRLIALFFFLALGPGSWAQGGKSYDGPLFDAHVHGGPPFDPEIIPQLKAAGIDGAMLMLKGLGPRELTIDKDFAQIFLMLRTDPDTRELLMEDETLEWLETHLKGGRVAGIGEIPLRHKKTPKMFAADHPTVRKILDLAARYRVPVNVHVGKSWSDELDRLLSHNRDACVIWAHMGDAPPDLVRSMLGKHMNLYADISCRNPLFRRGHRPEEQALTDDTGRLLEGWKSLFEEYPDRFLFGSDVGGPNADRMKLLPEVVKYYRGVLGQLSPSTAAKIGYENARKWVGLE